MADTDGSAMAGRFSCSTIAEARWQGHRKTAAPTCGLLQWSCLLRAVFQAEVTKKFLLLFLNAGKAD
jgi:hypothetical protein